MNSGAIILAGGRSRRMGEIDKLTLPIDGKPLMERVLEAALAAVDGEVIISLPYDKKTPPFDLPDHQRVVLVSDDREDKGPLVGVCSSISSVQATNVMLVAGDMPNLTAEAIHTLLEALIAKEQCDVVVPVIDGRRQVLCSAWNTGALARSATWVADNQRTSVTSLFDAPQLIAKEIEAEDLRHLLIDVDTPDDLTQI